MEPLNEPLLQPNVSRFVVHPVVHKNIFQMYKDLHKIMWKVEDIKASLDLVDWNSRLTPQERDFVKYILAFFASSDGIVNENLAVNFYNKVQYPEARQFYATQIFNEAIHSETYSMLISTYVDNEIERSSLFNAISRIPSIAKKANWALRWIQSPNFVEQLVAFATVEGVFFSGSFCAIFWLKSRGLMTQGLAVSNEYISRDEGIHQDFAVLLYTEEIQGKLSQEKIYEIIGEAVEIEKEFITDALKERLIGMNSELMCQYIEFVADRLIAQLGYPRKYGTKNPFNFMENISLENKSNFFEKTVTDYSLSGVGGSPKENEISFD